MRALKLFRYSSNVKTIINVIKNKKGILLTVAWFSFTYTFISALIMFNVEPETFPNLFDAVYWAVVSLTTVGYGDIYATTTIGKIAAMTSSILGIAIIALPTGIITASYQEKLQKQKTLINKRQRRKKIKNTYITKKN